METLLTFLLLIVIGAVIGGVTNSLAIKMLFRPHKPVYIGKWRLPFTPGLIPKRRDDMAVQLGKVVVEHLLTADGIQKKMNDVMFRNDMIAFVQKEATTLLESEKTIFDLAEELGIKKGDQRIKFWIGRKLEEKYWQQVDKLKVETVGNVFPNSLHMFIENKIPSLTDFLTMKAIHYFESEDGRSKLAELIDQFLKDKGTLGNIINMFLGNDSLLNKVQSEIIKFLKQPATKELLEQMIAKEWTSLKQKPLSELEVLFDHEAVLTWLQEQVVKQLNIEEQFQTPIHDLTKPFKTTVVEVWLPKLLDVTGRYLVLQIEPIMQKLHLSDIVKEQVESFPVERLETVVLAISRRELKMITYLGALLGGIIGAVQGVLLLFV